MRLGGEGLFRRECGESSIDDLFGMSCFHRAGSGRKSERQRRHRIGDRVDKANYQSRADSLTVDLRNTIGGTAAAFETRLLRH